MENILIFDLGLFGHHSEYIRYLINYLADEAEGERKDTFIFVVNPEFLNKFNDVLENAKKAENVHIVNITPAEYCGIQHRNLLLKSIKTYRLMEFYSKKYKANKVLLLHLNMFQLALIVYRFEFKLSGVLFQPFYNMKKYGLFNKLRYFRKYIQTFLLLKNKSVKKIFILNDLKAVKNLNSKFRTNVFEMLHDPIPLLSPIADFSIRKNFKIDCDRKILLHFGSLDKRKGTLDILDAFILYGNNIIDEYSLFLMGKVKSEIDRIIIKKIRLIKSKYPKASIVYKNEFVSEMEMKALFEQCDLVLMPYKNPESSSGVIGHAMASGKPVIGPDGGLLGEMIKNYNLGKCIKFINPKTISDCISGFQHAGFKNDLVLDLLEQSKPSCFAKAILKNLLFY